MTPDETAQSSAPSRSQAGSPWQKIVKRGVEATLFAVATVGLAFLLVGSFGPWRKAPDLTQNGIEAGGLFLIPALLFGGAALYLYAFRQRPGATMWLLIVAAALTAIAELLNAAKLSTVVTIGWGAVACVIGLLAAGLGGVGLGRLPDSARLKPPRSD